MSTGPQHCRELWRCVTASKMNWIRAYKTTPSCGQSSHLANKLRGAPLVSILSGSHRLCRQFAEIRSTRFLGKYPVLVPARQFSTSPDAFHQRRALDLDTIVSVLEVSATKRDAKGYLQTYASKGPTSVTEAPVFYQGNHPFEGESQKDDNTERTPLHVAIVKLRGPQDLDEDTILGVGKTLTQLRSLGLLSIVVLDCGLDQTRDLYDRQALNICEAIDSFSRPTSKVVNSIITQRPEQEPSQSESPLRDEVLVEYSGALERALNNHLIPIVPSLACRDGISVPTPVDANQLVLAITKYLTGKQIQGVEATSSSNDSSLAQPREIAAVERVIILDPLGGIPVTGRPGASHRFINLEQEFDLLSRQLMGPDGSPVSKGSELVTVSTVHVSNLGLAKDVLSILPPSSSALITTPYAAANMNGAKDTASKAKATTAKGFGFNGMVVTRKKQNPLLHNLLTDKPVYSSSLPVQRVQDGGQIGASTMKSTAATLLKRGMPLTTYPNPRINPWGPPKPGGQRLRLTDNCIDLPRLVYLIEDSFGRRLDVDDYLKRVNNNLAGVIIAGEYEGGAILTWEIPEGIDEEEAYRQGRLVPYLDKFAVLKSRQGSGGVADIVFNAMVRDCFPNGVCWRSRKNNPVNKWYFERSVGTNKLTETNWTMFWTTLGLDSQHPKLHDYESVCRSVQPSWADNKHIVD